MTIRGVLLQGGLADGEKEGLTASHTHDVLGCFVDLLLRLGFAACRLGVALALLLCPVVQSNRRSREGGPNEGVRIECSDADCSSVDVATYFAPLPMIASEIER